MLPVAILGGRGRRPFPRLEQVESTGTAQFVGNLVLQALVGAAAGFLVYLVFAAVQSAGALIDLFPMGSKQPFRIDLFDDEIETIRSFDVDTQRSLYPVREVQLLPGREFPMDEDSRNRFRARFREVFEGDPSRALPYKDIGNGIPFAGVEYYLPLFFEETATLFDYVPTARSWSPSATSTTRSSASTRTRPAATAS